MFQIYSEGVIYTVNLRNEVKRILLKYLFNVKD